MHGDRVLGCGYEGYFGGFWGEERGGGLVRGEYYGGEKRDTNGVVFAKAEAQAESLVLVEWVAVENADVHEPFLEVGRGDEDEAGGELAFYLK